MAFPTGWGRKHKITIDPTYVIGSSSLTDFPMLITLDMLDTEVVDAGSNSALNGGGDLRFSSDSAGSTQLPCEVVSFVTNATAGSRECEVWVKIPSVSYTANTDFYIWYNATGESQPAVTDTYGRNAVWSDYEIVLHDGGLNETDSTGNQTITTGNAPTSITGAKGAASQYDGVNDYIYASMSTTDISGASTLQMMFSQENGWNTNYERFIHFRNDNGTIVLVGGPNDGDVAYTASSGSSDANGKGTTDGDVLTTRYVHASVSSITASEVLRVDKTNIASQGNALNLTPSTNAGRFYVGRRSDASNYANFKVEEIRLRLEQLSSDWADTEYNNYLVPSTFATAGTPAAVGGDATATPTGVAGTGSVGSLSITTDTSPSLTGVSGTGQVGTLTTVAGLTVEISGNSATGSVGTLSPIWDSAISITGVGGSGAVGTLSVTAGNLVEPTGVEGTGQVGSLSFVSDVTLTITGVSGIGAVGDVTTISGTSLELTGVTATGAIGTLSVQSDVSVAISGNSATGAVGDISIPSDGSASLTGVSATGAIGTLTINAAGSWTIQSVTNGTWSVQSADNSTWSAQSEDDTTWTEQ